MMNPNDNNSRSKLRRYASLHLEPLEARRLLASLQVSVFVDQDSSRSYEESTDVAAANRLVFLDLNRDGERSLGEPVAVTNEDGLAVFDDLDPGAYSVALLTNPDSQVQSTDVSVEAVADPVTPTPGQRILADAELANAWTVDGNGIATAVHAALPSVDLGGAVIGSVPSDHGYYLAIEQSGLGTSQSQVVHFDTESGVLNSIQVDGLAFGAELTGLHRTRDSFYAVLHDGISSTLHPVQFTGLQATLGSAVGFEFDTVATNEAKQFIATSTAATQSSRVAIQDSWQSVTSFIDLPGSVESLELSDNGELLFAYVNGGGIYALAIVDGQLSQTAILHEAKLPIVARSRDGRIITGSTQDEQKLIVWDPEIWLPSGFTRVPVGSTPILDAATDVHGDRALIVTSAGTYSAVLASPSATEVNVDGASARVDIGLRIVGENAAPAIDGELQVSLAEDSTAEIHPESDGTVSDPDGDLLWYSLATEPEHGSLQRDENDVWQYVPSIDFSGQDEAVLRVHDGQASSELVLRWDVSPVNDPPVAIHIQLPEIPENPAPGTSIGFISIEDPDEDAEYLITTSDPRFSIQGGQIFFEDGELDFDIEPSVDFEITAIDVANSNYVISSETTLQLTDVNEPPTGLTLEAQPLPENERGAAVGTVIVDDPEAGSQYSFEVSDARFEVHDGVLRLIGDEELDFERESEIELTILASELGGSEHSVESSITVSVQNTNDAPTGIRLVNEQVNAGVPGAVVGEVVVDDQDNDPYNITVDDSRFEVQSGVLKLRDGVSIEEAFSQIPLHLVASTRNGDSIAMTMPINVLPPPPPNQNPNDRHDVNGDGVVSPADVLFLINEINRGRGGALPPRTGTPPYGGGAGEPPMWPDVNGDNNLTPMDVLQLINELNHQNPGEGEGELSSLHPAAEVAPPVHSQTADEKKFAIDAELEFLLEELSKHRPSDT
jgi:hypothetical protein